MNITRRGQAAIEGTMSIVGALLLLIGVVNVWSWFGQAYVARQVAFQQTREAAGSGNPGQETKYQPFFLTVFNEPELAGRRVPVGSGDRVTAGVESADHDAPVDNSAEEELFADMGEYQDQMQQHFDQAMADLAQEQPELAATITDQFGAAKTAAEGLHK